MKFVTKKEFDAAVATLKQALESNQLVIGHNRAPIKNMLFVGADKYEEPVNLDKIDFILPFHAAQGVLYRTQEELKKQKDSVDNNKKILDTLEAKEKYLQGILSSLKEG